MSISSGRGMLLTLGLVLGLGAWAWAGPAAVALDGRLVVADDSAAIAYIDLQGIWQLLNGRLRALQDPANGLLREVLVEVGNDPGLPAGQLGAAELARRFLAWQAGCPVQPTGGLWLGLGQGSFLRVILEARLRPVEVAKALQAFPIRPSPTPVVTGADHAGLTMPPGPGQTKPFRIDLRPDLGMAGEFPPGLEPSRAREWSWFFENVATPDVYVVAEVHGPRMVELLERSGIGLPVGTESAGLIGPEGTTLAGAAPMPYAARFLLRDLRRARLEASGRRFLLMAIMASPEGRDLLTRFLLGFIDGFRRGIEKGLGTLPPTQVAALRTLHQAIAVYDQPPWTGLVIEEKQPGTILATTLGLVGAVHAWAAPAFHQAREQERRMACFANQRVLRAAIERYNREHPAMIDVLDSSMQVAGGVLLREKYLEQPLSLPDERCLYRSQGHLTGHGRLECAFHGPVE